MDARRRAALLEAMMDELALEGYEGMSVQRALDRAGLDATELETEFGDKDGCLFAAYDHFADQIVAKATLSCAGSEPWPDRVRIGLATLLEELALRADLAQAIMRSFPGIRPAAYERYVALLQRFVPFMQEGRGYSEMDEELPSEVELLAVGAAESIIFGEVEAGRAERLPAMMPEILFSVLVPFIGPGRAADAMRSASAFG